MPGREEGGGCRAREDGRKNSLPRTPGRTGTVGTGGVSAAGDGELEEINGLLVLVLLRARGGGSAPLMAVAEREGKGTVATVASRRSMTGGDGLRLTAGGGGGESESIGSERGRRGERTVGR